MLIMTENVHLLIRTLPHKQLINPGYVLTEVLAAVCLFSSLLRSFDNVTSFLAPFMSTSLFVTSLDMWLLLFALGSYVVSYNIAQCISK